MDNSIMKKFYARLRMEGFIKALLCGLIIGFSVLAVCATVCWFVGFKQVWLCPVLFVVTTVIAAALFYRFAFSPNAKKVAKRIDALGLEERILTMTELEGDTSYIAVKQREDAIAALNSVSAQSLKLAVSISIIISCAAVGVLGLGMTTVHSLNVADVIPSGMELVAGESPVAPQYVITYQVDGDGTIQGVQADDEGNYVLSVEEGQTASAVVAVPSQNQVFVCWKINGRTVSNQPFRCEQNVIKNLTVTAVFQSIDEETLGDIKDILLDPPIELSPTDDPSNSPSEKPGGNPTDEKGDDDGKGGGAGGRYEQKNQVYDGNTFYGDDFDNAQKEAMNEASSDDGISDDGKGIIGDYFDTIAK